jgi:hypothetical protein
MKWSSNNTRYESSVRPNSDIEPLRLRASLPAKCAQLSNRLLVRWVYLSRLGLPFFVDRRTCSSAQEHPVLLPVFVMPNNQQHMPHNTCRIG